jgi:hypothetical protein
MLLYLCVAIICELPKPGHLQINGVRLATGRAKKLVVAGYSFALWGN